MRGDHLVALLATALTAIGLPVLVRRYRGETFQWLLRVGLMVVLLASVATYLALAARTGDIGLLDLLPFHLCDLAIFVAAFALLTRGQLATEVLYYWALAGTTLAIVTPDVAGAFPDWRWVLYFTGHGLVVTAATTLVFGYGLEPRPGSAGRVFLLTLGYAGIAAAVNVATGANFLYLARKPAGATLLDWFGPWPVYIGVAAIVAYVLFRLLELPFRGGERFRGP